MTVLLVSYPKSGTHLLDQILCGLTLPDPAPIPQPFFSVYESDGQVHTVDEALDWMESLYASDVASSHLYAWDRVVERACQPDFVTYFLYRDPRDICVSYVRHVMDIDLTHYHHDYYSSLPSFNARLMTSILDVPGGDESIANISKRFDMYLDWLCREEVLSVRFEDLIHNRHDALERIITHYQARTYLPYATPESLEACIDPSASPTFRAGGVGAWRACFTEEHKKIFKDVCGDLLVKLGYEKSNDW
jgi:hypothetical protein